MMVDNAIVVADGMSTRLQQGMDRKEAAIESASQPAWPLLGATFVAVMAYYPIFASTEGAGEYCRTLFSVVAISLLVSWVVSMTVTPLQCMDMLPDPDPDDLESDANSSAFYLGFRSLVNSAIRYRWLTLASSIALLVVMTMAFGNVKQIFFPDSSMTKFMIDVFAPEGTRIQQVAADLEKAEAKLLTDDRVESVTSFIGAGPPRFYLPVDPESPNQAYAQLIVNVDDYRSIDGLIAEIEPWFEENLPDALIGHRKFGVGPSNTWKFEARISGPAVADPVVLRALGAEGLNALKNSPYAGPVRTDWRDPVQRIQPVYSQERARWAAVTRQDIARAIKRAFDGRSIGLYREGDELIPIVVRHAEQDQQSINSFDVLQIQPAMSGTTVPLSQVTDGLNLEWENPILARRDRRRTITIQANPSQGFTLDELRSDVLEEFNNIELPEGYSFNWGGEYEDTVKSQASLIPGMVPTAAIVLFIIVALFNAMRPTIVILLTLPFAAIGIVAGLFIFDVPFGFVALLGAMSLIGMMIKNAVVLLDQVDLNLSAGLLPLDAIVDAAVSRLRPVALAAGTTVLGVIPLLQDVFWIGMSVTLMAGLSFGTLLTMILLPVLYTIVFKVPNQEESDSLV
jgi:multidrug efflux pump subunit AcrB